MSITNDDNITDNLKTKLLEAEKKIGKIIKEIKNLENDKVSKSNQVGKLLEWMQNNEVDA